MVDFVVGKTGSYVGQALVGSPPPPGVKCLYNISQFRMGFAQVRAGLQMIEDQLVCALASGFSVDGVTFDGSNDVVSRGGALTGAADGRVFAVSFWIKTTDGATFKDIFTGSSPVCTEIYIDADTLAFYVSDGTNTFEFSLPTTINDGAWHHVAVSADVNFSAGNKVAKAAIDGASVTPTILSDTAAAFDIPFSIAGDWAVGATDLAADIAEFWYSSTDYIDFSVAGNIQEFRSVAGKPVNLGADGSIPTGTPPIIYLRIDDGESADNFAANAGSGGDFTVTGALTTASTSPSD